MKIENLELFTVAPRWLFLKVTTDSGIAGWGEPVLEGRAATVRACVEELTPYLVGADPSRIEDLFQVLYRGGFYRGGAILMSAVSGIEQALWDIKGKHLGAPVYDLLGGRVRDRIRMYTWIGGDRPKDVAAQAAGRVRAGFTAVKMNATEELDRLDSHAKIDEAIERVAAVRASVGTEVGVAVDFHGRVHRSMAKVLVRELEPYRLMFIEEPLLPEHNDALREIARYTSTPIATGERMYTRWEFKHLLEARVADIIQPDVSHAGGILECKKIAAMAESYDVAVAMHCPLGPIALAASLQVDACTPNAIIQEQSLGIHYNDGSDLLDYLIDASVFDYAEGYCRVPDAPGLGIEIDEVKVRAAAQTGHEWKNPVWRHKDGSLAEW